MLFILLCFIRIGAPGQRGECQQAQPISSLPGVKGDQGPPGLSGNKEETSIISIHFVFF